MDRAAVAVDQLGVGLEVRAARAVPALVRPGVDIAAVVNRLEHALDRLDVARVGRADEEVVGDPEAPDEVLEPLGVAVGQLAGRDALALRGLRHRLAVLVGPGEEEHVLATLPHVPRQDVGRDRGVRVAEMRLRVHVVDRRGDVVGHAAMLSAG